MKKPVKNSKKTAVAADAGHEQQEQSDRDDRSLWQDPFVHVLLILVAGFVVYFNSINVPFIFDDYDYLVRNPVITSFDCFPDTRKVFSYAISHDVQNNLVLRPATYFTFAVNYALHGFDLFGYHLVNLLLHLGCAILVYVFFALLMATPAMADEKKPNNVTGITEAGFLPLFAALLFVCHPLQTQAVTYIIQRFVPLATFFYLAALVLYALFRREPSLKLRAVTYALSLAAAVLAMESKEIAFTLPLVVVLVEFIFFRGKILSRLVMVAPFLVTMALIPAKLMQLASPESPAKSENVSSAINLVNFGDTSSWDYLMTQFGVITTYIRLLFLPVGQNFDYDYPLQKTFLTPEVLLPLALLLMIAGTGIYLLTRSGENRLYKIIAFGIFWFFITLSVESSIVPIADLVFEQRAYLPSVGFFISLLAAAAVIFRRLTNASMAQSKIAIFLLLSVVVCLSAATIARNRIWQDEEVFWKDVVKKSPNKARAHRWLGSILMQQSKNVSGGNNASEEGALLKSGSDKQLRAAIGEFKEAIRLEPESPHVHRLLAEALMLQKNYDEALRSLSTASALEPASAIPYTMRGDLFELKKDLARARQEYIKAVKIEPSYHVAHEKLADIYAAEGNVQDAIRELELVMRIYPEENVRKKLEGLKKR